MNLCLRAAVLAAAFIAWSSPVWALTGPLQSGQSKEAQTPDQAPVCSMMTVPAAVRSRKLTPVLERRFESVTVREYVQALRKIKYTLQFADPPAEFTDMVEAGKNAVPYLIGRLGTDDGIAREAANYALVQITNKRFLSAAYIRESDADKIASGVKQFREWWARNQSKSRTQWLADDVSSVADDAPSRDLHIAETAIILLGQQNDVTAIPALRKALNKDKLSFYAAGSLARLGDKTAVPYLIDLYLGHEVDGFRLEGLCLLYRLTKRTFDFDPSAPQPARDGSIQRWKQWWQTRSKN